MEEEMSKEERAELFSDFRKDIQLYFTKNLKYEDYYIKRRINEAEDENIIKAKANSGEKVKLEALISSLAAPDRWQEYEKHKKEISKLCGWDAGRNYDQNQYDKAVAYLIEYLKL